MPAWIKALLSATVAVFLVLTVAAYDHWKKPAHGPAPEDAVIPAVAATRVPPALLTHGYYERAMRGLLLQKQLSSAAPSTGVHHRVRDEALRQLVSGQLLYQIASAKVQTTDLERQVKQLVAVKRSQYGNEAELQHALKEIGLDLPALQEMIRRDLLIERFIEEKFGPRAACSETEARRFYEENRNSFKSGPSVRASQILISVSPRAGAEERRRAREKAQGLLSRVREGENFGVIAEQYSNCPSRVRGGDIGFIGHGEMDPAIESAASALKVGGISELLETPFGFHVIKVTEKRGARLESYQRVRERVMQELRSQKIEKMLAVYLAELKSKGKSEDQ